MITQNFNKVILEDAAKKTYQNGCIKLDLPIITLYEYVNLIKKLSLRWLKMVINTKSDFYLYNQ